MSKRKRFILISALLSLGFIGINFVPDSFRFIAIGVLSLMTIVLFAWSLWEGLSLNATLLTLVLPLLFTISVGLFWFLLPSNLFARIPVVIFYGLGIYALCLTANIYTVSAIRTIALLRAARGVGFVLTLVTFFLVYDAILSLRAPIYIVSGVVLLTSFLLFLQGFWTIVLEKEISSEILKIAAVSSLAMGEIAASMYFWPVTVVVGSLFFTVGVYMLLGLGQAYLEGRLFNQTVRDHITLGVFVFIGMFLATRWGS
ncbi:hypothetical protein KA005_52825 [bacterium]|nr:hypothetical protein [bacterium]